MGKVVAVIPYLSSLLIISHSISVLISNVTYLNLLLNGAKGSPPATWKGTSADTVKIDNVIETDIYFHCL